MFNHNDPTGNDKDLTKNIEAQLYRLFSRLDSLNLPGAISNNIYIHPTSSVSTTSNNQFSQTEFENVPSCKECEDISENNCNLSKHDVPLGIETTGSINCIHCKTNLSDESALEHHMQDHHGEVEVEMDTGQSLAMCETCGVFFEDEMSLQTHIDNSHVHIENCEDSGVLSPSENHRSIASPPAMDTL